SAERGLPTAAVDERHIEMFAVQAKPRNALKNLLSLAKLCTGLLWRGADPAFADAVTKLQSAAVAGEYRRLRAVVVDLYGNQRLAQKLVGGHVHAPSAVPEMLM